MGVTVILVHLLLYEKLHAMILACCMIEKERKETCLTQFLNANDL